jgi:hypothetical protein
MRRIQFNTVYFVVVPVLSICFYALIEVRIPTNWNNQDSANFDPDILMWGALEYRSQSAFLLIKNIQEKNVRASGPLQTIHNL